MTLSVAATTARLSAAQGAFFTPSTSQAFIQSLSTASVKALTGQQILLLSSTQKTYFTGAQLSNLSSEAVTVGLNSADLAAIATDKISMLGKNFIDGCSAAKFIGSTISQLSLFSSAVVSGLNNTHIATLSSSQLNALFANTRNTTSHPSELTINAISGITATNVTGITADQIKQ